MRKKVSNKIENCGQIITCNIPNCWQKLSIISLIVSLQYIYLLFISIVYIIKTMMINIIGAYINNKSVFVDSYSSENIHPNNTIISKVIDSPIHYGWHKCMIIIATIAYWKRTIQSWILLREHVKKNRLPTDAFAKALTLPPPPLQTFSGYINFIQVFLHTALIRKAYRDQLFYLCKRAQW